MAKGGTKTGREDKAEVVVVDEGFIAPLTDNTQLRVSVIDVGGVRKVSVREWYKTVKDPTWKPGFKGVTLPLRLWPKMGRMLSSLVDDNV